MIAKNFSRSEIRYHFKNTERLEKSLNENLGAPKQYSIQTDYMDFNEPTWSQGKGDTKYRLRRYIGDPSLWYETKKRVGNRTVKHREKIDMSDERLKNIRSLLTARYDRTAWEKNGVRVTMDRHLLFKFHDGVLIPVVKRVVEVKCKKEQPEWLTEQLTGKKPKKGKWSTAVKLRRKIVER